MVIQGLKNFFISLKHFFTPLGTLCLGMIFGLSVFFPTLIAAVRELTDQLVSIAGDVEFDPEIFLDTAFDAVTRLDWSNPLAALNTVIDGDWLMQTFESCAGAFFGDMPALAESAALAIEECIAKIVAAVFVFFFFVVLGLIGGYFLLKAIIRHNIAKRALWKYFLASFLDSLLSALLIGVCAYLFTLWQPSALFTVLIALFLFGLVSLIEAYALQGGKKIPVNQVVNGKNVLLLPLTNLLIFIISLLLTGIATALTNQFVGLFIGLSLLEIAFLVSSMNAEAYVKNAIEKLQTQKPQKGES